MVSTTKLEELTTKKENTSTNLYEYWKKQVENAEKVHERWLKESEEYYDTYLNKAEEEALEETTYNILYSNTETKRSLLFNQLPKIDIRRRYRSSDRVSRITSELLERVCNYFLDKTDAENVFKKSVVDYLISGRGVVRNFFETGLVEIEEKKNKEGKVEEEAFEDIDIDLKKVETEFINYDRFLVEPAKKWEDVSWIAFMHLMNKDEVEEQFGKEKIKQCKFDENILTSLDKESLETDPNADLHKRAIVWEIWDKDSKEIVYWSNTHDSKLLARQDDIYNLVNFFPIPRPLGVLSNNRQLIPVPEYRQYKVQAQELNSIENRIRRLIEQSKAGGVYNKLLETEDAQNILNNLDGDYSPVAWSDPSIPLTNLIYSKDITSITNALSNLYVQKQQIVSDIKEITGLSDIVRGETKASETATAQRIKGDFAISRMQTQQREVELFVRDVLRIMCELIAENYSAEELATIGGLEVINVQEIQQQAQASQTTPEQTEAIAREIENKLQYSFACTTEELSQIDAIIKNDKLRSFSIDIETESTIRIDNEIEKQQRIEFLNSFASSINQIFPMVQAGVISEDAFRELTSFVLRPFKVGRNLEQALLQNSNNKISEAQAAQAQAAAQQQDIENKFKQQELYIKDDANQIKRDEIKAKVAMKEQDIESKELTAEFQADNKDIKVKKGE